MIISKQTHNRHLKEELHNKRCKTPDIEKINIWFHALCYCVLSLKGEYFKTIRRYITVQWHTTNISSLGIGNIMNKTMYPVLHFGSLFGFRIIYQFGTMYNKLQGEVNIIYTMPYHAHTYSWAHNLFAASCWSATVLTAISIYIMLKS